VIDLHLHTTASDGRSTPDALVAEAAAAGVRTIAVTDHDTVAGVAAVRSAAARAGLAMIAGIEITAVHQRRDIHVLGYFIDDTNPALLAFLETQRASRRARLDEIVRRLSALGVPVDVAPFVADATRDSGRAVGRPAIAQALVAAGHVRDVPEAFDRYLAEGRSAFVPRVGPSPRIVVDEIGRAGGIASLAHPGKLGDDGLVDAFIGDGLEAIEVYHPDHDGPAVARYRAVAIVHDLLVTGGSDYHGPSSGRSAALGQVGLPAIEFARLAGRARDGRGRP
jgi:predicted metal-dependent phosphoesterase TrpH